MGSAGSNGLRNSKTEKKLHWLKKERSLQKKWDFTASSSSAFKQWTALKAYANAKGVEMIGDIPIYVAFDSADAWAQPELFQFDKENIPIGVAGCPPDAFSATGQLWEIRFMTGNITRKQAMHGGHAEWQIV